MNHKVTITFEGVSAQDGASKPFSVTVDMGSNPALIRQARQECFDHVGFFVNDILMTSRALARKLGAKLVYIGWPE